VNSEITSVNSKLYNMTETIAGLFGGCAGVLVGHPFDTVKVKLQTQDFRNPRYSGTLDCFRRTVRTDGVRGLYRGMASPMAGVGGINAIVFGVQAKCNRLFRDPDALRSHFLAGSAAGLTQSFVCSPLELSKTRLQLQAERGGPLRYKGALHCFAEILKAEGPRGVARGQLCTIFREVPAFGTYFVSFEVAARAVSGCKTSTDAGSGAILLAGGLAGMSSWLISYPVDVVKSRIQCDGAFGPTKYSGIVDCIRKSKQEEGLRVFTRGLNSAMIRAFPTNAATFYVVSYTTKFLNSFENGLDDSNNSEVIKKMLQTKEVILSEANTMRTSFEHRHTSGLPKLQFEKPKVLPNVLTVSEADWHQRDALFCNGEEQDVDTYQAFMRMLRDVKSSIEEKTLTFASELVSARFKHHLLSTVI